MKIDFRKIEVFFLDGTKNYIDVSKLLGNSIYNNTPDLGELEIARDIYKNGAVDLTHEQAEAVKKYVALNPAFATEATCKALDEIINSKKQELC